MRTIITAAALLAASTAGARTTDQPATTIDITNRLDVGPRGLCELDPRSERLMPRPGRRTIALPGGRTARVANAARRRAGGGTERTSTITLPAGTTWRGLVVTGIRTRRIDNPESEGVSEVAVTFAATPRAVGVALRRTVPVLPDRRVMDDAELFPHGGAEWLERRSTETDLVCAYDA